MIQPSPKPSSTPSTPAIRAALYARVSTLKRGDKTQDPEIQLSQLREHAKQQGWTIEEYVDRGVSGAKESRPELDRLMRDAQGKKFDVVLVWKFDRFARSVIHLHKALQSLRDLGIRFMSLTEAADTQTTSGRFMFTILGAVAEMERELIAERTKAGMNYVKANGTKSGVPVGRKAFAHRHEVKALIASGVPKTHVARQMNISVETVRRIGLEAAA